MMRHSVMHTSIGMLVIIAMFGSLASCGSADSQQAGKAASVAAAHQHNDSKASGTNKVVRNNAKSGSSSNSEDKSDKKDQANSSAKAHESAKPSGHWENKTETYTENVTETYTENVTETVQTPDQQQKVYTGFFYWFIQLKFQSPVWSLDDPDAQAKADAWLEEQKEQFAEQGITRFCYRKMFTYNLRTIPGETKTVTRPVTKTRTRPVTKTRTVRVWVKD